jgi:heme-degrading monooxygenase HmoA
MEGAMHAVIFEFTVRPGREADYFAWAERLRPELEKEPGFLSIERFESRSEEGRFVSISYWRDEAAVRAWRAHPDHAVAQAEGREITLAEDGERRLRDEL